jgi:Domain of unknown function (DUF1835)
LLAGDVLPWRDVLHEGPVPPGLRPAELRAVRARFVAECGWASFEDVLRDFERRDRALEDAEEVVLWFERDLYDQLQMIQVLDRLDGQQATLVDLGEPQDEPSLDGERQAVADMQVTLARRAWAAFRSPDPSAIERLIAEDTDALPHLGEALVRHLEQYPSTEDGLSRAERRLLEAVASGARTRAEAFVAQSEGEERPFMGDASFLLHLERLLTGPAPLLSEGESLALTSAGEDVLAERSDHVSLNGIDRWLGGVHLAGARAEWRWDPGARRLRSVG